MYFSIFTPTNNPEHLIETYASLLRQTVQNWEWVIVPNGDALKIGLHTLLSCTEDDRVRIVDYPQGLSHNIGALKNFACSLTRGKVLVELDHDDWLLPDCLSQLGSQFDRKADFVY
jgi:glycosyltransferase involved in cell wall biosynthesis